MPYTRPSAAAAAAGEPPQYVLVPGHGTGKQIKAYHVAANPNRRQTKEHEPTGWPRGQGSEAATQRRRKSRSRQKAAPAPAVGVRKSSQLIINQLLGEETKTKNKN